MDIIGGRKFLEVPGQTQHELPPLLVSASAKRKRLDRVMNMAAEIVESEELCEDALPFEDPNLRMEHERRRMDLAVNLVEQYMDFVHRWQWGNAVVEWIRQCEITFGTRQDLRNLLRPDLWPHAGRSSFVTLLEDKGVKMDSGDIENAVGLRLTFRQPPPISCFSDQFLLYLNSQIGSSAYQTWAHLTPDPISSLPPERFSFQVVTM